MILQNIRGKVMAVFFHLLYHEFAGLYDFVSWTVSIGQWKKWVQTALPHLQEGVILELGFGPGHLQEQANKEGRTIFGLDESPQMSRLAKKRLIKSGYASGISLGNANHLPFETQTLNQVMATFPTEYFLETQTLQEIYRVLKPGGEIILVPMAWIRGNNPVYKILAWVFKITGQSIERNHPFFEAGFKHLEHHGFEVEFHTHKFEHSEVLNIIARKSENRSDKLW